MSSSTPPADTAYDVVYTEGLVLPDEGCCFHCGEPLPKVPFVAYVLGADRQMCCLGCQLAAQSIVEAHLEQYYLDRQKISRMASMPAKLDFGVYNHEEIKAQFSYQEGDSSVAELSVVGLRCAACTWLIESRLNKIEGVGLCQVNLTQQRMRVAWHEERVDIGTILQAINEIGYDAKPYRQDTHEAEMKRQNKIMLIRLGVAAIGAMQAMMFSIGLYFGQYSGMAAEHRDFLRLVAMIVSIPVVFYAGLPFFRSAMTALKVRQVNMDVPVSIALVLTFLASSYAVLTKSGETYFDSVAMFVFFLLAGRYVEHTARLKAANLAADLLTVEPKLVNLLSSDKALWQAWQSSENELDATKNRLNQAVDIDRYLQNLPTQGVPTHEVAVGDIIQVAAGDEIVADGVLLSASANVSQGLLTGEGELIAKYQGDVLLGGSQNDAEALVMMVTKARSDSQLALIDRLINRALSEKPKIAVDADRMARWFVARVLVLSFLVFVLWWWIDPSHALWATVAVLVATCPCALSLATPMALTVATNRLAQKQLLVTRGHTVPTLAQVTHVAFDKTGTLTTGTPNLLAVQLYRTVDLNQGDKADMVASYKAIAAALEMGSRHPMAQSLIAAAKGLHLPKVAECTYYAGGGIEAWIDGRQWRIGHGKFASTSEHRPDLAAYGANMSASLAVADGDQNFQVVADFYFNDSLRTDAKAIVQSLQKQGICPIMLTGDPNENAKILGDELGVQSYLGLLPEDKVQHIQALQKQGAVVLMVGDGINDAPVLAAADVSVAMANATDLAQVASDGVLLGSKLEPIVHAIAIAKKTQSIIRQNLRWAFFYNTAIIIPAAIGYVPPWAAAIGMSLSSLLVVLNALRIKRL